MSVKIAQFARRKVGHRVYYRYYGRGASRNSRGECWDLAEKALEDNNFKTSSMLGPVEADSNYVWGNATTLGNLAPGDIIQFRNYRYEKTVDVTNTDDESGYEETSFAERPHHTAIVDQVNTDGSVVVLEQNVGGNTRTHRNTLYFQAGTTTNTSGNQRTTTTITVTGTLWYYRPIPNSSSGGSGGSGSSPGTP